MEHFRRAARFLLLASAALAALAQAPADTLPAPRPLSPADGVELHSYPRDVWFEWTPVPQAESYTVEIDCEDCCAHAKFCSEVSPGRTYRAADLRGTRFHFEWFGDQRGRWRVWASAGFLEGEKSPWQMLSFTTGGLPTPPQAPKILAPENNALLPANSSEVTFEWTPVAGARSYSLEVDPLSACSPYKYCSDVGVYNIITGITGAHYTGNIPPQMWTRWRVWAIAGDRTSLKTPWTMFQRPVPPTPVQMPPVQMPPARTTPPLAAVSAPANPQPAAPAYSPEARAAGLEGVASVYFELTSAGEPHNLRILEGLGLGLDEKALELVSAWRFAPSAPPVQAAEVAFHLDNPATWRIRSLHYTVVPESRNEPDGVNPVLAAYRKPDQAACPAGEHSIIRVSFDIDKSGHPANLAVESSPAGAALRTAVKAWTFQPASLNGQPRAAHAVVNMECGLPAAPPPAASFPAGPMSPPSVLFKADPAYSEEARLTKFNGSVAIQLTVDADGFPGNLKIARPIGLGLDEKALDALKQWRFKPALRAGHPVPTAATVEINFRLL